jgi:hypothetical protein
LRPSSQERRMGLRLFALSGGVGMALNKIRHLILDRLSLHVLPS